MTETVFWILGIFQFFVALVSQLKKRKYVPVDGLCLQTRVIRERLFAHVVIGTYQYFYNNQEYIFTDEAGGLRRVKTGKHYKLFVDPNNPEKCLTPAYNNTTYFYILAGTVIFYLLLSNP